MGKEYEIMGLLWRGSENDVETPVENLKEKLKTYNTTNYQIDFNRFPLSLENIKAKNKQTKISARV